MTPEPYSLIIRLWAANEVQQRRNKDESCTDLRRDGRRQPVQSATGVEPRRCALRFAQRIDVGVDRHLEQRTPTADNKQRKEKNRIEDNDRRRNEKKQSNAHRAERNDNSRFIQYG